MSGSFLQRTVALLTIKSRRISLKTTKRNQILNSTRCFSSTSNKNMKIVQFTNEGPEIRVGYVDGNNVVDINKADPSLPTTLLQILKEDKLQNVYELVGKKPASIPITKVNLVAPITGMDKVLCIGLNYKDHCEEQNLKTPPVPMIFNKFPSVVIGQSEAVKLRTEVTKRVDWEVELAVVFSKKASFVKAADAYDYVLGYTVAQDISARDWQKDKNMGQFLLGKAMDTFCPIGPWIVTKDEIADPQSLDISCSLNGELKQKSNTNQLVHKIPDVIERLTSVMTLLPGDILLTGTPGGVGMYRQPPEYLKPGDVLVSEVGRIGSLETRFEEFH